MGVRPMKRCSCVKMGPCEQVSLHMSVVGFVPALHKCCHFRTELGDTLHIKMAHALAYGRFGL